MAKVTLPRYLRAKRLKNGTTAYFWELPHWARPPAERDGKRCPVHSIPLGTDLAEAIGKADAQNEALDGWREGIAIASSKGTVRWLFAWYREQERFTKKRAKTRKDYHKLMDALSMQPMKTRLFGDLMASKIEAGHADKLYAHWKQARGVRQATYAMQVCRLVWNWAVRHKKTTGVTENPFKEMALEHKKKKGNRPTSRAEYERYKEQARELGYQSMAAAAALAFELCQRTIDCFGYADPDGFERGIKWVDYEPGVVIRLRQSKTGNELEIPLSHIVAGESGPEVEMLYPELEAELARAPQRHDLIVVEERNGKPYAERRMSTVHREICEAAGLPKEMTFTGFRHGGSTELGDAGEVDIRAISGHRTLDQTAIYNKASAEKARRIAAVRRQHVERIMADAGDAPAKETEDA